MTNNLYIPLENRSALLISGADARGFLQGLITNDMNKVSENQAIYATMLTPQGKFLYDFFIAEKNGAFMVDCNKERLPAIAKKLSMYKLRSDVKIEDVSAQYKIAALFGDLKLENALVYADPREGKMGLRAFVPAAYQPDLPQGTFAEYEKIRIEAGLASGDIDMEYEDSYPLFFGMDEWNGVDFKKGCYVGQEVTARMHHKTELRKKIYVIESADKSPLAEFGSEITADGDKIGKLLSSVDNVGLALLLSEKVEKQNFVYKVGGQEIIVRR